MDVLILEDHPLVLHGLESILQSSFPDVRLRAVSDLGEAMTDIQYTTYDLAIVDLCIRGKRSFDFLQSACTEQKGAKHLVFTSSIRRDYYEKALNCGADGYLVKECTPDDLVYAVKTVMKGRRYIDPIFMEVDAKRSASSGLDRLTARETEILRMVGKGLSNRQIAEQTYITVNTVKKHITNILNKMEFNDRKQAILFCQNHYV